MQKDEVFEFLGKIDAFLGEDGSDLLNGKPFELKIFGKSALLLAGLSDSVGTKDMDVLKIEGYESSANKEIISKLEAEFGKSKFVVHGYFLEFVGASIIFLPPEPIWIPLSGEHLHLNPHYLEPNHVAASKLFSAYADRPRPRDKQDIEAALDQGIASLPKTCEIAEEIFDCLKYDARSDRFPDVYRYLTEELMADYGEAPLRFDPDE